MFKFSIIAFVVFFYNSSTAQCVFGDCINGLGSKIMDQSGYRTEGFFENGLAVGPSRLGTEGSWEYGNISAGKQTKMVLLERKGQLHLWFYDDKGAELSPGLIIDSATLKTISIRMSGNKLEKPLPQNGKKIGCIVGDCNMGYGAFLHSDGVEFHGVYFFGVPRRGIIIYPNAYYIGEVDISARKKMGFGYLRKGNLEYLGHFSADEFQGQGFEIKKGKLTEGGQYVKGKLQKNKASR